MAKRVALVTGSNKGVGFAIVRSLCQKFDGDVLLTARDETRGRTAVKRLEGEGLHPMFHQLDINDHCSLLRLRDFIQQQYGGLDILVNNAGIVFNDDYVPFAIQAEETTRTNFFSTLDACNVLFPLLRPHARVVNVSSMSSQVGLARCSEALRAKFTDPNITMEELTDLIKKFVDLAKENQHTEAGYCGSSYFMSKIGVTVMSMIQQRELDRSRADDVIVNACCPGYVDTDLNSHQGTLTVDEGAVTPVYCALLPPNVESPRGKFIREKKIADWKM
ncbi:Carbonyl reductase [NADPH] 3 [Bulinus truncatus]|nr:Carbonyl reductase [NADPH] 3 [Bulinus truncatus]